jgi:F0F1-type ATP synthase epsilon subunit
MIELSIITPTENKVLQIEWIEVISPTGTFWVGPDHAPLVSLVKHKAPISFKETGKDAEVYEPSNGIFYVSKNKATLLCS